MSKPAEDDTAAEPYDLKKALADLKSTTYHRQYRAARALAEWKDPKAVHDRGANLRGWHASRAHNTGTMGVERTSIRA